MVIVLCLNNVLLEWEISHYILAKEDGQVQHEENQKHLTDIGEQNINIIYFYILFHYFQALNKILPTASFSYCPFFLPMLYMKR